MLASDLDLSVHFRFY